MKQERKVNNSFSFFIVRYKVLFFVLLLVLLLFSANHFMNKQKQQNKLLLTPTPTPTVTIEPLEKLTFEIPADWKTYSTNKIMNIHPEILQKHPGIELPILSFRYPPTWHIKTDPVSLGNMDFKFPLLISIRKIHPKNGSTLFIEGLLPDNLGFQMSYGVTPDNLMDFDDFFWGAGQSHTRRESFAVDGRWLTLGYYESNLVGALYHISQNAQLWISIDFENSDSLCQTQYCISTKEEIKQVLSSFRFSNFTKSELPNRLINEQKRCISDKDCKISECTCEAFNKNQNVEGCPGRITFCPGKPECLYNQCLFLQSEADRP